MRKLRSTRLAGGSAVLLVLALTGLAAAAPLVADPSQGFVDLDGNGVSDQCEAVVAADPIAAAEAFATVDADGDGTISVREAAHSGWVGGKNCNHGGFVSSVAGADEPAEDPAEEPAEEAADAEAPAPAVCPVTEPAPPAADAPVDTAPNAHGKAVSAVAQSDAVGGKNCNHGGAVSAAAKKGQGTDAAKVHGKPGKPTGKGGKDTGKHAHGKGHTTP